MTQPEPTVWSVTYPPEPGPEVTAVRDTEGDTHKRGDDGDWWLVCAGHGRSHAPSGRPWHELFEWGPLTDATHEPTQETTDA